MTKFLILLFLFGIVMFLVGLMKPERAVAWGSRTRGQAALTYLCVILASIVGLAMGSRDFLKFMDYTSIIAVGCIFGAWGFIAFLISKHHKKEIVIAYLVIIAGTTFFSCGDAVNREAASFKVPANVIVESTDVGASKSEDGSDQWRITIRFRETAGETGAKGDSYGFLYDAEGGMWKSGDYTASDLQLGSFAIGPGESYDYAFGFTDHEGIFRTGHVDLTFTFTDEAGRTSEIPWSCRLE